MMTDDPVEEHRAGNHKGMIDIMMCYRHCGDYFIRRNNRQKYCDKEDCQNARNAKNQRVLRNWKRMAKAGKNSKHETDKKRFFCDIEGICCIDGERGSVGRMLWR